MKCKASLPIFIPYSFIILKYHLEDVADVDEAGIKLKTRHKHLQTMDTFLKGILYRGFMKEDKAEEAVFTAI